MPSVVLRTCKPRPAGRTKAPNRQELRIARAPFRRLSTRALRQAVLRASSGLAPSRPTRPCDLPARKTRDASNRLLPPKRVTCTRTPFVPGSSNRFRDPGHPTDSEGPRGGTEDLGRFTRPRPLRRIVASSELSSIPRLRPRGLRTRTWACSSHGAGCDRHLTPLSQLLRALAVQPPSRLQPRVPVMDSGLTRVSEGEEAAKARIHADS